jgi:CubicO group peptidase (beta-lactamase class C family)
MKKIILIVSFTFYVFTLIAQQLPAFITDSLENYVARGMKQWRIPGLSLAIIKDGKIVFIKGYGVTRAGGNEPVDENTLFMIGSNTKAFTATTLNILQQEGKVKLNDRVRKWMPEFRLKDTLASNEIIIYDLLCHRIGFETFQGDFTYWTSNLSREEVIHKMSLVNPIYNFRTKWGYCNAAFLTAGQLIPRITGKSWEETVKEKILIPLKMTRTLTLSSELKSVSNHAYPHTIVDGKLIEIPIPEIDNLAPAGSISSSAKDMATWVLAHLNNGKSEGNQVIPQSAIQAIRVPYSIQGIDPRDKQKTHFFMYGLGLFINDRNGELVYSHTGGVNGFVSSVMFIPEENAGIIVLTNTDQNNFYENLTEEIRDAFLRLPYQDFSGRSLEFSRREIIRSSARVDSLKNVVKQNIKPNLPLMSYSGKYVSDLYGEIDIKPGKNFLTIYFSHHPGLTAKLECTHGDTFLCTYSDPTMGEGIEFPFKTENGKVTEFTLRVANFVEFTPYIFKKEN